MNTTDNSHQDPESSSASTPENTDLSLDAFRTDLDVFSGPLELLMYLIRRDEVDILEIPIAHITDEYLKALRTLQLFDVNVAAEFMVMAATLMDVKSRSLLPDNTVGDDEEEDDPRDELVHQLLEYKRFKKASAQLRDLASLRSRQFSRVPPEPKAEPDPVDAIDLLEDVSVWDLLSAYGKVIREIEMSQPHQIVYDEVPIKEYMGRVMERLSSDEGETDFLSFFQDEPSRSRIIGLFLALLELVRQHKIEIDQKEDDQTQISIEIIEEKDQPER